jgi:hypothetical protein
MPSKLTHGPDGRFIGMFEALFVWLPVMLGCREDKLLDMLSVACSWCDGRAADCLERGARLILNQHDSDASGWNIRLYEKWLQRRAVLQEAAAKPRAIV